MLQLDVSINFNLFDIIKITGNGQIRLNTTPDTHTANGVTMNAHSFRLHIDGQVSLLEVIKLDDRRSTSSSAATCTWSAASGDTQYDEVVAEGQWFFLFTGSANFFGIATLNASGWVDSKGHFGVDLNGGITIGSSSFGLSGSFDVHAWLNELPCSTGPQYCGGVSTGGTYYTFGVAFSASVNVNAFGFSLASVGIGARLTASGTGTVDLVASVHFHISFLFFSFSATASFDIGTVQLPKPIYLAGVQGPSGFSVGQSAWQTGGTTTPQDLYLNMGSRAAAVPGQFQGRGLGDDQPNESFTIDHISGTAGDEKIQVTAFGHSQTFMHVHAIYANGAGGDDTIIVNSGVLSPVFLYGGDGNDVLFYDGSGGATLDGGNGDDVIQIGPDAGGTIVVTGDAGTDFITDASHDPNVFISGGDDGDNIVGGFGANDTINGDGGNDVITSNGPSDHINGGAGDDTIVRNGLPTGNLPDDQRRRRQRHPRDQRERRGRHRPHLQVDRPRHRGRPAQRHDRHRHRRRDRVPRGRPEHGRRRRHRHLRQPPGLERHDRLRRPRRQRPRDRRGRRQRLGDRRRHVHAQRQRPGRRRRDRPHDLRRYVVWPDLRQAHRRSPTPTASRSTAWTATTRSTRAPSAAPRPAPAARSSISSR